MYPVYNFYSLVKLNFRGSSSFPLTKIGHLFNGLGREYVGI
jgi:hypothetical protein